MSHSPIFLTVMQLPLASSTFKDPLPLMGHSMSRSELSMEFPLGWVQAPPTLWKGMEEQWALLWYEVGSSGCRPLSAQQQTRLLAWCTASVKAFLSSSARSSGPRLTLQCSACNPQSSMAAKQSWNQKKFVNQNDLSWGFIPSWGFPVVSRWIGQFQTVLAAFDFAVFLLEHEIPNIENRKGTHARLTRC